MSDSLTAIASRQCEYTEPQDFNSLVAEALDINSGEIRDDALLMNDLEANRLDLLQLQFALELRYGIPLPMLNLMSEQTGHISQDDYSIGSLRHYLDEHGAILLS